MIASRTIRNLGAGAKIAFAALFLVNSLYPGAAASGLFFACFLVMAALSVSGAKPVNLIVSAALTLAGGAILYRSGADFAAWRGAALENAGLVALILTTPLLSICLRYYDFETDIRVFAARHVRSGLGFYALIMVVSFVVSLLLNMGAVPLLFYVFDTLRKSYPERTLYNALTRGYFINVMWSPNYVSIVVVVNCLDMRWGALAGWGLAFALAAMLFSVFMEWLRLRLRGEMRPKRADSRAAGRDERDWRKGICWIAFIVAYVMAGILALGYALGEGIIVVVPLVSVLAPVALAACMGRWAVLWERLRHYFGVTLSGYNNEVFLFCSAGFLAAAFRSVDAGAPVAEALGRLGVDSILPLAALLIAFVGLPPLAGVHPIITISALASVYAGGGLAISPLQLALAMLAGYHMYAALSPFSSGVLLLSGLSGKSTLSLGLGLNGVYVLLITIMYMALIALL